MGGVATFSGTDFQVRVATHLACYIIGERRAPFVGVERAVLKAISFERQGAGDDLRLETHERFAYEVQVKRGLNADDRLLEVMEGFSNLKENEYGVLIVDTQTSSKTVQNRVADIFQAWRDELEPVIPDELKAKLSPVLAPDKAELRKRIVVFPISVELGSGGQVALEMLRNHLEIPERDEAALSVIHDEIHRAHPKRGRIDRARFVRLLSERGVEVREREDSRVTRPDARARTDLAHSTDLGTIDDPRLRTIVQLLKRRRPQSALDAIDALAIDEESEDARFSAALLSARGTALMELGDWPGARHAFEQSIAIRGDHVPTLTNLAAVLATTGHVDEAVEISKKAASYAPSDASVWAMRVDLANLPLSNVPPERRAAPELQLAVAVRELRAGQLDAGITRLRSLQGDVGIRSRVLLAEALLERAEPESGDVAEALAISEAEIADTPNLDSETGRRALFAAALAMELLGMEKEAVQRYKQLRGAPNLDRRMAVAVANVLLEEDSPHHALEVLSHLDTATAPVLAARARAHRAIGDSETALALLEQAVSACGGDDEIPGVALAALELESPTAARRVLARTTRESTTTAVLTARLGILEGSPEAADAAYSRAVDMGAERAADVRLEYAHYLRERGELERAFEVIEPNLEGNHQRSRRFGAELCAAVGRLALAREMAEACVPALWAHKLLARISVHQGDLPSAAKHLQAWIAVEPSPLPMLWLAECYWKQGEESKCRHLLEKIKWDACEPVELMALAQLHAHVGESAVALQRGYDALRGDLDNARIQLAFFSLALERNHDSAPARIERGAACTLEFDDGVKHDIVFTDAEQQPIAAFGEISTSDPRWSHLLGKSVGDTVAVDSLAGKRSATITAVFDRYTYAVRWVLRELPRRDPSQTHLASIRVLDDEGQPDFSKVIDLLKEKKQRQEELLELYATRRIPLGAVAAGTSLTLSQAYALAANDAPLGLMVESPGSVPNKGALETDGVVLTHSGLFTLVAIDGLDVLQKRNVRIYSTQSLVDALVNDVQALNLGAQSGIASLAWGSAAPHLKTLSAVQVARERDKYREALEWVRRETFIVPRPADWQTEHGDLAAAIGQGSLDACLAAREKHASLYADDYGLRWLAAEAFGVAGFSTYGLVRHEAQNGRLGEDRASIFHERLLMLRHTALPVPFDTLMAVLQRNKFQVTKEVEGVLWHFRHDWLDLRSASYVAALVLRHVALDRLHSAQLGNVSVGLFEALFHQRRAKEVNNCLRGAIGIVFKYVPLHGAQVLRLLEHYLQTADAVQPSFLDDPPDD